MSVGSSGIVQQALKLDPQGNWLWNRRFPSAGIESVRSITTDSAKNIIVSGLFSTTIDFGGGILATAGGDDIFLLKLDSSGQHLWSRRFGSVGADFEMTAEVDAEGNLYLSGISQESLDLGCGTMPSAGDKDIVIAKLDPSGECLWSKRYGDDNAQDAVSLAVLPDGGVVASGHFRGKLDLGALSLSAPGDGAALAYVFRLDQDGNPTWSRVFGDVVDGQTALVQFAPDNDIRLFGSFASKAMLGGSTLVSNGLFDTYAARLHLP